MGSVSNRIRQTLVRNDFMKIALRFHDSLVLKFLNALEENHNQENEEMAKVFEQLEMEWIEYCMKRGFVEESHSIFSQQCTRILNDLKEVKPTAIPIP